MSLTKPFINTIVAFDATNGTTQSVVNILGGDAITSYTYQVFLQSTDTVVYTNTISASDVVSADIRTYNIDIPATILTNNNTYYIQVYTSNSIANSAVEISAPFDCYITPSLTLQWGNNEVVSGTIFNAPNINIQLLFNTNDVNSVAKINSAKINVYGVSSSYAKTLAFGSKTLYGYLLSTTLENLTRTNGDAPLYTSYDIEIIGETIDGFVFTRTIRGVKNEYAEEEAGVFTARNDCANGVVNVSFAPSSLEFTQDIFSNIKDMVIDNVDRTKIYFVGKNTNDDSEILFAVYDTTTNEFDTPISLKLSSDRTYGFEAQYNNVIAQDEDNVYICGSMYYGRSGSSDIYILRVIKYNKSTKQATQIMTYGNMGSQDEWTTHTLSDMILVNNKLFFAMSGATWQFSFDLQTQQRSGNSAWRGRSLTDNQQYIFYGGEYGWIYPRAISGSTLITSTALNMDLLDNIVCDNTYVYCGDDYGRFGWWEIGTSATSARGVLTPFGSASQNYAITSITQDETNVYIGNTQGKFAVFSKATKQFSIKEPFSNEITAMAQNGAYVYCCAYLGSAGTIAPMRIYVKAQGEFITSTGLQSLPIQDITASTQDDDYIYYGNDIGQMCIYSKKDNTFSEPMQTLLDVDGITAMVQNGNYVYLGGFGTSGVNQISFIGYDKNNKLFTTYSSFPDNVGLVKSIYTDGVDVYIGGTDMVKFNIANQSFQKITLAQPNDTTNLVGDETNLYYTKDSNTNLYICAKSTPSTLIKTLALGYTITCITQDDKYLYCGTTSGNKLLIIRKADNLTYIYKTLDVGFNISTLCIAENRLYCWSGDGDSKYRIYNLFTEQLSETSSYKFTSAIKSAMPQDEYIYVTDTNSFATYYVNSGSWLVPLYSSLYRREEDGEWVLLQEKLSYNDFIFYDTTCRNNTLYEYKLIQEGQSSGLVCSCVSKFHKSYICDGQTMYDISNEYTLGDVQTVQKTVIYEPYGAKYPTVAYNAETLYRQGALTAVLLAPTSQQSTSAYIDRVAQVNLVKEFNNWLSNKRAKIIKDINGNMRIVAIYDNISNDYYKELGNAIASTAFNWVEVGDFSGEDLLRLGIANTFKIVYN